MERLLARIDAWGEVMDAKTEAIWAETKAMRDKRMEVNMKACQETTACHERTKADTERTEPDPAMVQSVGWHQEVPKEEGAVMPVGGLRKLRGDRILAARRRQKPRGRIQASRESWRELAVACREMTHHAKVSRHREHHPKRYDQDNVAPRSPIGRTSRIRR
jgi:hypothetical protein